MHPLLRILISLRVVVISLAVLMVLVLLGTLHQVEYGLYSAQQKYFFSWGLLLFGFIPFPGTQLALSVLFVNLTAAMLYRFRLGWGQAGLIMIHLGLMLLLAGGWFTHRYGEEGFLSLAEGEGSNVASDYRAWEMSVTREPGPARDVVGVDTDHLKPGVVFDVMGTALRVEVDTYYRHCRAFQAADPATGSNAVLNASGIVQLQPSPRNRDPEADTPGLICRVTNGAGESRDLLLFGVDARPTAVTFGDETTWFSLRRKRYPLPVFMRLVDFERAYHPGSNTPKLFKSLVDVHIGGVEREVVIEMNKPFRFKGFTFFQASFSELDSGSELSTFAVTRNYGRLVPYIATGLTVAGLVLHFVLELAVRTRHRLQQAMQV